MTNTTPGEASARTNALPWPSLIVLATATFIIVTAEMLPTALLPELSEALEVDEARIGLLVSIWAGTVVIASLPLVRIAARWERRTVITVALLLLAASSVLSASAGDYAWLIVARVVGALAVGLLWATINAYTADIVADSQLAPAVAVVLGGATLGTVIGTAGANLVAVATDWRAPFVILAALAVVVAVLVRTVVITPDVDRTTTDVATSPTPTLGSARRRLAADPMILVTALVGLMLVGHYGAYTFITRLTDASAALIPGGTASVLLVFGITSALGIAVAGRFGSRTLPALIVSAMATSATVLALSVADADAAAGLVVVALWGAASGALPALAQTLILRLAGSGRRGLAGALIPILFNVGVAAGAALASLIVAAGSLSLLPVVAAAIIAVAIPGLILVGRSAAATTR